MAGKPWFTELVDQEKLQETWVIILRNLHFWDQIWRAFGCGGSSDIFPQLQELVQRLGWLVHVGSPRAVAKMPSCHRRESCSLWAQRRMRMRGGVYGGLSQDNYGSYTLNDPQKMVNF